MQLQKRAIYKIEMPINSDKIMKDLTEIKNQLAPGKHSKEELIDFIQELDKCRITEYSDQRFIEQLVRSFYYREILTCGDIAFLMNQFNWEIISNMADAAIVLSVNEGDVSFDDYIKNYDEIQDDIVSELEEYTDLDHLLAECVHYDSIEISPTSFEDEEYFEYTGIDPEELKALRSMKLIDEDIKIFTNDCQEVLIPELMMGSCVFSGDGNINYYKHLNFKQADRKLIGG